MEKTNIESEPAVSGWIVLFINLLLSVGIGWAFWQWKGQELTPCVLPLVGRVLWGLTLLFLFQTIWRIAFPLRGNLPPADFSLDIGIFKASFSSPSVDNLLNLRMLSIFRLAVLLGVSILFILLTAFLDLPFIRPAFDPPIIQEFSVLYLPSNLAESHHPGDAIEVKGQIRVEAKILGACAQPCEWFATKGNLLPGKECNVLYTPSVAGGVDNLTVVVRSPCNTLTTSSTLFITP